MSRPLSLRLLSQTFAIARLPAGAGLPWWAAASEGLLSFTRTPDETSLVCEVDCVPLGAQAERGFRAIRIVGTLAFGATGILVSLADPLAHAWIPIFVISTFDTDYVLIRDHDIDRAIEVLQNAGHTVSK
jgi:hypothetical protein